MLLLKGQVTRCRGPYAFYNKAAHWSLSVLIHNTMAFYSIDESITSFFKYRGPLTRSDCDKHATAILGSTVRPLDTQGQFSYIVGRTDGTGDILQYRDISSTLSLTIIDQAKQAHGKLVAGIKQLKIIQKADSALNVYMVKRKSGELYIISILDYYSGIDERKNEMLERTITSLTK